MILCLLGGRRQRGNLDVLPNIAVNLKVFSKISMKNNKEEASVAEVELRGKTSKR